METFVEELKKQSADETVSGFRRLKAIKAGRYELSIQGSEGHYSFPRQIVSPEEYTAMEIAIFNKKGWFYVTRSSVIRQFPRYRELCERADGLKGKIVVFGYVPVDLIEDLYLYLKNHK